MNSKSTWIWITIAGVLFGAVVAVEKFARPAPPALVALLPNFRAADITSVQYAPAGQLEIRANRTNSQWQLVKPIAYPAQSVLVDALLLALQQLAPAHTISAAEVRQRKNADAEFGFATRTSLSLYAGEQIKQLLIGNLTAPGDGLYLQVVGTEGVFVVDARLLQFLPGKVDDWRDTGLVDLRHLLFDRIAVSNATTVLQLAQESSNTLWRLTYPIQARADNLRLAELLQKLHGTRVKNFVTDDPKSDAESFGFQAPELELTLSQGTNPVAAVQFGKSPTNDATLVYARRAGFPTVVTVERQALAPWLAPLETFRDPYLVTRQRGVEEIEVRGVENFVLQRVATNSWKLVDSEMPVDSGFVGDMLLALVAAPILKFEDAITEADLPKFGLAAASSHEPVGSAKETAKRRLGLKGVKSGLLREVLGADDFADTKKLAATIKCLPLTLRAPRPLDEAISSAGGVPFPALDDRWMLRALPGVFCAGEMVDWEAPTGGYLLTASFATGRAAGLGVVDWLRSRGGA